MADSRPQVAWFGDGATLDHVGVAVRSLAATGIPELAVTEDARQRVSVAFVEAGGVTLELIEPLGENSPITRSLQNRQQLVHLCFRVPDLELAIDSGKQAGFHRFAAPAAAPAFDGRRIAWMYHPMFGVMELLEAPR